MLNFFRFQTCFLLILSFHLISGCFQGTEPDKESQPAIHIPRALILDHHLAPAASWSSVRSALQSTGLEVTYRRFQPHLRHGDVENNAQTGRPIFDFILVAAGLGPANPSSLMRVEDVAHGKTFLANGGLLFLAPQAGYGDSPAGENDWFLFNRLLEETETPIRIEKNTLVGTIFDPNTHTAHKNSSSAYATSLEEMFGFAFLQPGAALLPFVQSAASGRIPLLRSQGEHTEVLLRTFSDGFVWDNQWTEPSVSFLSGAKSAAVVAPSLKGYVAVAGRSLLNLNALPSGISEQPTAAAALSLAQDEMVLGLITVLMDYQENKEMPERFEFDVEEELFSPAAPGWPALHPEQEIVTAASNINSREVTVSYEGEQPEHMVAAPNQVEPIFPPWAKHGKIRVGYGNLPNVNDHMGILFDEADTNGLDILMTSSSPEWLIHAEEDDQNAISMQERYGALAAYHQGHEVQWFIGSYLTGMTVAAGGDDLPRAKGAQGQAAQTPALLHETLWSEGIWPTCEKAGELARDNPEISGFHMDFEQYAYPLWHSNGWSFSDDTFNLFLDTQEESLQAFFAEIPQSERLNELVDNELLGLYFSTLENLAYEKAKACRDKATALAPHLYFSIYLPGLPSSWFYNGLLRGLGTPQKPVIVMSFDSWSENARKSFNDEGISMLHLGGTLTKYWKPEHFDNVLGDIAKQTDGYWFLATDDLTSSNDNPPNLHGEREAYWEAIQKANGVLAAEE